MKEMPSREQPKNSPLEFELNVIENRIEEFEKMLEYEDLTAEEKKTIESILKKLRGAKTDLVIILSADSREILERLLLRHSAKVPSWLKNIK